MWKKTAILVIPLVLLYAQRKQYQPKAEVIPGPPVKQPVAFSHKTHVSAGMKCTHCHTMPGDGWQASFPKESFCMGCHATIKNDSPEIARLAAFASKQQPVPWVRIYRVPDYVWFNHASHVEDAKLDCSLCHGDVARLDVLFQAKSVSMQACMDCHAQRKAPNECDFCHTSQ